MVCIKGAMCETDKKEVRDYFKALILVDDNLIVDLCEIQKGREILTKTLDQIKCSLPAGKTLDYYGYPSRAEEKLYQKINDSIYHFPEVA